MKKIGKNVKLYLIGMIIGGMTLGLTTVIADTIINSTNVSYKTSTVKAALDDLYGLTADDVWQKIYPIGSIYTSVSPTSPATLFGGTWERFGNGKVLAGVDESDDAFKTVGQTGGSKTKTIAVENLPAHTHTYTPSGTIENTGGGGAHNHSVSNTSATRNTTNTTHSHSISITWGSAPSGSGWRWLAPSGYGQNGTVSFSTGASGGHTHQVTDYYANTTTGNHTLTIAQMPSHNHTFTGTASSTTACTNCSGTALNVQNPYITVYMWKRTA